MSTHEILIYNSNRYKELKAINIKVRWIEIESNRFVEDSFAVKESKAFFCCVSKTFYCAFQSHKTNLINFRFVSSWNTSDLALSDQVHMENIKIIAFCSPNKQESSSLAYKEILLIQVLGKKNIFREHGSLRLISEVKVENLMSLLMRNLVKKSEITYQKNQSPFTLKN